MSKQGITAADYIRFIGELKSRVAAARLSAARAVNHELILLYWDIGKAIVERQQQLGWGQSVVEQMARDLRSAFPCAQGFSARNVWDMRRFYDTYSEPEVPRQLVAAEPALPSRRRTNAKPDHGSTHELLRQAVAQKSPGVITCCC